MTQLTGIGMMPTNTGQADVLLDKAQRSSAVSSASASSKTSANDSSNNSTTKAGTGGTGAKKRSKKELEELRAARRAKKPPEKWHIRISRIICANKFFQILTTCLTVYALVGDDLRLLYSNKPADTGFNVITLLCMIIFFFEVLVSCFGKDDYFGGFFFTLDLISTSTLCFDLSWVSESLQGDEEDSGGGGASGTAGIARVARVVRVLRLVRILKLYKAIFEARQAQKKKKEMQERMKKGEVEPGMDDDWEMTDDAQDKVAVMQKGESRVGKRLSDMTTRKVILLVLLMMAILPMLQVTEEQKYGFAPLYGADMVHDSFQRWDVARKNASETPSRIIQLRRMYEHNLLQMVYYHNWYTGRSSDCPIEDLQCSSMYFNQLFWVGVIRAKSDTPEKPAGFLKTKAEESSISEAFAEEFAEYAAVQKDIFNFGSFPQQVQKTLSSKWVAACNGDSVLRIGFSVLKDELESTSSMPGVSYAVPCPEDLRRSERSKYRSLAMTVEQSKEWHIGYYFDKRRLTREQAGFSLGVTSFVCVVLCVASIMFASDADKFVLNPVEQMIAKVEKIRNNPLMAMKLSDEEFKKEEIRKAQEKQQEAVTGWKKWKDTLMCASKAAQGEPMETLILEKTIIKIGSLLALGFGEAGANIIEHNMSGVDSAMVTAMVEGQRVECIIGCARIRDFSIATEVLRGKVMTFVNQMAEIVHGVVDENHGAANKNNGEYFLLIWRTSDLDQVYASKLADMSMLAFVRILGAIHRSPVLASYRFHPGLQMRMGNCCRVNCSFGLHYGWAIEGAVGSEFKIDASYLSPNVSIAESLEGATYIYGVHCLISELVLSMCSTEMAAKCRLIDKVLLTGMTMQLYVIDLDFMSLVVEPTYACPPWNPKARFRCRQFLDQEKALKWCDDVKVASFFNEDPDIVTMRFRYTLEFMHVFNMGYQNYSEGEWKVARRFLSLTRTMLGTEDGPSAALLRFMDTPHKFEKPPWWKGIRDLGQDNLGL